MKKQTGFTIVELLIVIVVIGILAAISITAYNGVQNRANDSAVRNDLRNFTSYLRVKAMEDGSLPTFGSQAGNATTFPGVNFAFARNAYYSDQNNVFVCRSQDMSDDSFAIAARSKSGTVFAYTSSGSFRTYTTTWPTSTTICPHLGYSSFYFSYGKSTTTWFSWTQ